MTSGRPAVFLDKDGTPIEDVPYSADPARLRFTPHALPALRPALAQKLWCEGGVALDGFFFCPHAADAGCDCRKPAPGLLLDVGRETPWQFTPLRQPRYRAKDLLDTARFILESPDMNVSLAGSGAAASAREFTVGANA